MPQPSTNSELPFPSIAMPFGGKPTRRIAMFHLAKMILWVVMFLAAIVIDIHLHRLFWTWIALVTTLVAVLASFAYSALRLRARMKYQTRNPSFRAMVERLSQSEIKGPGTVEFAAGPVVVFTPATLTFSEGERKLTIRAQEFALKGRPKKPTFVLRLDCWDPPFNEPLTPTEKSAAVQFINAAFSKLVAHRPRQESVETQ